jgi:hypothetical protein
MVRIEIRVELNYDVGERGADFIFNIHAAHTPRQTAAAESLVLNRRSPVHLRSVQHGDADGPGAPAQWRSARPVRQRLQRRPAPRGPLGHLPRRPTWRRVLYALRSPVWPAALAIAPVACCGWPTCTKPTCLDPLVKPLEKRMNTNPRHPSHPTRILLMLLAALGASTALAAGKGATSDPQARYQREAGACNTARISDRRADCLSDAALRLAISLPTPAIESPAALARNVLKRCEPLPEQDRKDCVARMQGQGTTSGSVAGGGMAARARLAARGAILSGCMPRRHRRSRAVNRRSCRDRGHDRCGRARPCS